MGKTVKQNLDSFSGVRNIPPITGADLRAPRQSRSRASLDRLLQAAEAIIARDGVEGLTLAEMVRDAGSSNGAFYARFTDKAALVRQVQERFLQRTEYLALAQLRGLAAAPAPLARQVAGVVAMLVDIFRAHAGLIGAFMRWSGHDPVLARRAAATGRVVASAVAALLRPHWPEIIRANPALPPETAIDLAYLVVSATIQQSIIDHDHPSIASPLSWDDLATQLTRLAQLALAGGE